MKQPLLEQNKIAEKKYWQ